MKYCDGECGVLERFFVKQLLSRSHDAREFCASLREVRRSVRQHDSACLEDGFLKTGGGDSPSASDSLWEQIKRRLVQEERTALFLGTRREVRERPSVLANWMWGGSGAVTAAALVLISVSLTNRNDSLSRPAPESVASSYQTARVQNQIPGVQPISSNRVEMNDVPRPLRSDRGGLELEWVRSDGHVRFLSDSQRTRSFIWVQRRSPLDLSAPTGRRNRPFAQPTGIAQGTGESDIIELQHSAPRTLSVSNR